MTVAALIFPDVSPEQVHSTVAEHWDLSGPYPVPTGQWIWCRVCGTDRPPQARWWRWHTRDGGTIGYRCDVAFKCTACSAVWQFGIPVPKVYYRRYASRERKFIHWREVKAALAAAGMA